LFLVNNSRYLKIAISLYFFLSDRGFGMAVTPAAKQTKYREKIKIQSEKHRVYKIKECTRKKRNLDNMRSLSLRILREKQRIAQRKCRARKKEYIEPPLPDITHQINSSLHLNVLILYDKTLFWQGKEKSYQ
jgi:hypothetical protein